MKTLKLQIDETSRTSLKEEQASYFNSITEYFNNIREVKDYLIDRYGKMPGMKKKIYIDDKNGNPVVCGFLYSFWDQDISHMTKKYYQTDWVTVKKVTTEIILL